MNAGILPLGGPKAAPPKPTYELMLRVTDLNDSLQDNTDNTLLHDTVLSNPYNAYNTTNGIFTVPKGKGGLYLVQLTFLCDGASGALAGLVGLSVYGSTYGRVFLTATSSTLFDTYIREARTGFIELHEGEEAYVAAYLTDVNGPTTWTAWNELAGVNEWTMFRI